MTWWGQNWQWATGVGVGALGIVVALVAIWWQRKPKRLDYLFMNNVPIVSRGASHLKGNLAVSYNGVPMNHPRVVIIRIANTGKRAVRPSDFETPITITYEREHHPPFDGFMSASSPHVSKDIKIEIGEESGVVELTPGLLNPREWFEVQLISDGPTGGIQVTSRFADQASPMRGMNQFPYHWNRRYKVALGVLLAAVVLIGYLAASDGSPAVLASAAVVALGATTYLIGLLIRKTSFLNRWSEFY